MAFHHVALATRDLEATHAFYTDVMSFTLVKAVAADSNDKGDWAKHLFYDTGGNGLIAFWELHGDDIPDTWSPAISTGLGLTVAALTEELADQFKVEKIDGVIVLAVEKGMPAALKHLQPGDIITSVDQKPVATPKQFRDAIKAADAKKGVAINFKRAGTPHFETLKEAGN